MTVELTLLARVCYRGVEITGSRLRGLLALLAADLPAGCGAARLVESLWPDEQPEHPAKALQTVVSRARARLGPEVIRSTPTGYRLALGPEQVDASAVLLRAAEGERSARAGDHAAALGQAEAGLALFGAQAGGTAGGTVAPDPLSVLRDARLATYRTLTRMRSLALSRLGRPAEAVEPLTRLVEERPRDEETLLELLRCEAATVGPATALARYDAYRRALREELGTDPGPALRAVHRELLLSDAPVRRGLRHEPNELLGRDWDIAAVRDLLGKSRVVSIVGAGGLGKTRLAQAVGRQARQRVVHVVELAGVTLDGEVLGEVAFALGVGEATGRAPGGRPGGRAGLIAGVVDALGPGPALLVLDNCEHLVHGVAELVQALVSLTADLHVLTTSRAPLGLSSEWVYALPELDLPTTMELFGQRARAARPGAELQPDAVRVLCARLDGLPLAVELAAARIRVMSVADIADRLDDRFALLRGGTRDAPSRHRTLHAVIDWSWHLLEPAGQAAMRALSVFPGGFTADAVRHLAGDGTIVAQLVDQSLLKVTDSALGTRFRMLETVREFSVARRDEAGETAAVVDRFLAWARDLGAWRDGPDFAAGLVRELEVVRAEQDNLVRALRLGLDRDDGASVAAAAALLGTLWLTDSNLTRLTALAEEIPGVLSRFRPGPAHVEAVRTAAVCCTITEFITRGPRPLRALVVLRRLPPPAPDSVIGAAQITLCAPDVRALRELCASERPLLAGTANYAYSYLAENANDPEAALRAARRMLACLGGAGPWLRALAHARIGELCLQADPGEEAFRHLDMALALMEELGAWSSAARARWAIVLADLQRGAFDRAEQGLERLALGSLGEEAGRMMFDLCTRAEILLARGDVDAGLRLWRRAADGLRSSGDADGLWAREVQAVAVVAHCRHGRLDLVEDIAGALPAMLSAMLPSAAAAEFRFCGALLAALAVADLERGATAPGVRMIALAERFGLSGTFQPAMSAARVRDVAEHADRAAYTAAATAYAGLDHDGLRAAALTLVDDRGRLTGSDRG